MRDSLKTPDATYLYRKAVAWIADNDDPAETRQRHVSGSVSVKMVADLFGRTSASVASAVIRRRRSHSKPR